jgi:hypothetical protein
MFRALEQVRVPDDAITNLVAVGAHGASSYAEKIEKLGREIVAGYCVIDHVGTDDAFLLPVVTGPGWRNFKATHFKKRCEPWHGLPASRLWPPPCSTPTAR